MTEYQLFYDGVQVGYVKTTNPPPSIILDIDDNVKFRVPYMEDAHKRYLEDGLDIAAIYNGGDHCYNIKYSREFYNEKHGKGSIKCSNSPVCFHPENTNQKLKKSS